VSGFARFVELYWALDAATSAGDRMAALESYFREAEPADLAWAMYFLTGRRLRRPVSSDRLRAWASEHTGLPPWLIEASYRTVGDLAETLSIICTTQKPPADHGSTLATFVEREVTPLGEMDEGAQRAVVLDWWHRLDERSCFIAHKLATGASRAGVPASIAARALAQAIGLPQSTVEHRLMGPWEPTPAFGARLTSVDAGIDERSHPYPFQLATRLDIPVAETGNREDWLAEWIWHGIRAQLIARGNQVFVWSRAEELITERFPEIAAAARALPDGTVLDGEIVVMHGDRVQPFAALEKRIRRKALTPHQLRQSPAVFIAFDVMEDRGADVREQPLVERRRRLDALLGPGGVLRASPRLEARDWGALARDRDSARTRGVEGIMLKRLASPYQPGRSHGVWWTWKVEPHTMDAVLVYAEAGQGTGAARFVDYTFAVWDHDALVPVAKADSGLDDTELARLDKWIRAHTLDRFGPVRAVEPLHVFELGFEAIQRSTRHKSGIAVRLPRILRWRVDKRPREASSLADLEALIDPSEPPSKARAPDVSDEPAPSLFDDFPEADPRG
jgi:DNA ligase-1